MTCKPLVYEAYQPEVSTASPSITPMPSADITITTETTVSLQYPYTSPTTTLTLRNPELNNTISVETQRIQGYTRGDTLYQYRDPLWFKTRHFNWTFTALTRQNRLDILAFVLMSAGQYIQVTDYNGQQFKCIITNPDAAISQTGPDYAQQPTSPPADPLPPPGMLYTWSVNLQKALI